MRASTLVLAFIRVMLLGQTMEIKLVNETKSRGENNSENSSNFAGKPVKSLEIVLPNNTISRTNKTRAASVDKSDSNQSENSPPTTSSTLPRNLLQAVNLTASDKSNSSVLGDETLPNATSGTFTPTERTPASAPTSHRRLDILTNLTSATTNASKELVAHSKESDETVIYSWIFFCHGITSPIEPYPSDRYSPSYWQFQLNWLTKTGQKQMYELGKWIRDRYLKLCQDYHPRTLEVLTESSDCTFMSAESLLTGLFPFNGSLTQTGTTVLETTRNWQPIPVHTVQSTMALLGSTQSLACRQYDIELDDVIDKAPWSTIPENYFPLIKRIADQCGYNFVDISLIQLLQTVYNVYYDLKTEELAGLRLPKWARHVYPEPMQTLAAEYLELFTFTDTLQRLKAGPTIGDIVNSMRQKTEGNLQENLKLYSGSQYSVTSIMNALGVFNHEVPPFASAFLIELSKSNDQFFVTMLFKNSSLSPPHQLSITDCGYRCRFDKFQMLMQNKIPTNWTEECDIIPIAALTLSTPLLLAGLVVIIVLIFLALLLLVKCCRCFNKKKSKINNY